MSPTPAVLSVRVSAEERDLLVRAADQARTPLGDVVRRKAIEGAGREILDHRLVTIPAEDRDKFEAWANTPPREVPALRALCRRFGFGDLAFDPGRSRIVRLVDPERSGFGQEIGRRAVLKITCCRTPGRVATPTVQRKSLPFIMAIAGRAAGIRRLAS